MARYIDLIGQKSELCFQAMQHGIIWARLLAAAEKEIPKYYLN